MPYTSEHKETTRRRIVQSARRLFNRHGFNDVSIDEIMAEAGLTRGGFYNHFGTKEELYAEVVLPRRRRRKSGPWHAAAEQRSSSPPICRTRISRIATMAAR